MKLPNLNIKLRTLTLILFSQFILLSPLSAETPGEFCMNKCNESRCKDNPTLAAECVEKCKATNMTGLADQCSKWAPAASAVPAMAPDAKSQTPGEFCMNKCNESQCKDNPTLATECAEKLKT